MELQPTCCRPGNTSLRSYQARALDDFIQHISNVSNRSTLFVGPTGMGKTVLGIHAAMEVRERLRVKSVLWIAHTQELVSQAAETITRVTGFDCATVPSQFEHAVWCATTIQSLLLMRPLPGAQVVVFDEAHHHVAKQWKTVAKQYENAFRIGLTATPYRTDGIGLGNVFDHLIVVAQPKELIAEGYLVPVDVYAPSKQTGTLAMAPVNAWREYCEHEDHRKQCIVFAGNVGHAHKIAEHFREAGVEAIAVHGKLNEDVRADAIARFRRREICVLINVFTLTEGFDAPCAEVAILCRGFSSQGSYLQAVGRIMRPWSCDDRRKERGVVVDLTGASLDHGLPEEDRAYSLDDKDVRRAAGGMKIRQCRRCSRVYLAHEFKDGVCPSCGFKSKGRVDPAVKAEELHKRKVMLARQTPPEILHRLRQIIAICRLRKYNPKWIRQRFHAEMAERGYDWWPTNELVAYAAAWKPTQPAARPDARPEASPEGMWVKP